MKRLMSLVVVLALGIFLITAYAMAAGQNKKGPVDTVVSAAVDTTKKVGAAAGETTRNVGAAAGDAVTAVSDATVEVARTVTGATGDAVNTVSDAVTMEDTASSDIK